MDISETLFQAVGILIDKKIESVKFDETIEATIVDAVKAEAGEYQVSTGNAKFTAYSMESQYRVNDVVLVTIPQGDYDNQKIIVSKKVDKNNTPMIYKSPFQQLVDISTNLIGNTAELNVGMWANGETEAWREDELNPGGEPIWSREFNGEDQNSPPLQGYTRIGLQGQFSTYLADFDTIKGNYGLALKITFSAPQVKDSANTWDKWVYLDSDSFLGDPYNFETYYTQEDVFDIEEYKDYPITKLELYAYQRCNFYDTDGNRVPTNDDGNFSSIPPNIFIKDPYICVGIPVDSFDQDTAEIYSDNGLNYTKDYDEDNNAVSRFDNNAKTIQLRWVHRDEEKDLIKTMQYDDAFDDKYEIRWYVYQLGAQSPDQFAGAHWVRLYGLRAAADETGSYVISEEPVGDGDIIIQPSDLQIQFYPNVNHQEEKIKAIIVKRETDYENVIYTFICSSNELILTNNTLVRNQATVIDMNALSIKYVTAQGAMDDTLGKFFVYNRADKVSKNEYLVAHYLEAVFDPDQPDVYQKAPLVLGDGDSIEWIFPSDSTMIIPGEQTDNGPIHSSELTPEDVTIVPYFIKDYLNRTATNNTVICKVLKDGLEYVAEVQMLFGTAGTSGSDYTLTLTWRDGKNALDVTNLNPDFVDSLVGQVELYDSAGRPVLDTVDNYELTYDWYVADQINTEFGLSDYELETKHLFYPVGNDDQVLYTPQTEQEHVEIIDDRAKFCLPAGDSSDLYDFSFNENKFIGNGSNGIYRQRKDGEEKYKFSFTNVQVIDDSSSNEVWIQEVNNTNNIAEHILDESQPSVTDIISAIKSFFLAEDENGNMNEDVLTTSPTQHLYDDVLTDYFTLYNELAAKNLDPEDDQNDLQDVYNDLYGRPTQSDQSLLQYYINQDNDTDFPSIKDKFIQLNDYIVLNEELNNVSTLEVAPLDNRSVETFKQSIGNILNNESYVYQKVVVEDIDIFQILYQYLFNAEETDVDYENEILDIISKTSVIDVNADYSISSNLNINSLVQDIEDSNKFESLQNYLINHESSKISQCQGLIESISLDSYYTRDSIQDSDLQSLNLALNDILDKYFDKTSNYDSWIEELKNEILKEEIESMFSSNLSESELLEIYGDKINNYSALINDANYNITPLLITEATDIEKTEGYDYKNILYSFIEGYESSSENISGLKALNYSNSNLTDEQKVQLFITLKNICNKISNSTLKVTDISQQDMTNFIFNLLFNSDGFNRTRIGWWTSYAEPSTIFYTPSSIFESASQLYASNETVLKYHIFRSFLFNEDEDLGNENSEKYLSQICKSKSDISAKVTELLQENGLEAYDYQFIDCESDKYTPRDGLFVYNDSRTWYDHYTIAAYTKLVDDDKIYYFDNGVRKILNFINYFFTLDDDGVTYIPNWENIKSFVIDQELNENLGQFYGHLIDDPNNLSQHAGYRQPGYYPCGSSSPSLAITKQCGFWNDLWQIKPFNYYSISGCHITNLYFNEVEKLFDILFDFNETDYFNNDMVTTEGKQLVVELYALEWKRLGSNLWQYYNNDERYNSWLSPKSSTADRYTHPARNAQGLYTAIQNSIYSHYIIQEASEKISFNSLQNKYTSGENIPYSNDQSSFLTQGYSSLLALLLENSSKIKLSASTNNSSILYQTLYKYLIKNATSNLNATDGIWSDDNINIFKINKILSTTTMNYDTSQVPFWQNYQFKNDKDNSKNINYSNILYFDNSSNNYILLDKNFESAIDNMFINSSEKTKENVQKIIVDLNTQIRNSYLLFKLITDNTNVQLKYAQDLYNLLFDEDFDFSDTENIIEDNVNFRDSFINLLMNLKDENLFSIFEKNKSLYELKELILEEQDIDDIINNYIDNFNLVNWLKLACEVLLNSLDVINFNINENVSFNNNWYLYKKTNTSAWIYNLKTKASSIGQLADFQQLKELYQDLKSSDNKIITLTHLSEVVSNLLDTSLGEGEDNTFRKYIENLFDQYGIKYQVVINLFATITNIYNSFNRNIEKADLLEALEDTMVNKTSSMVYKIYDNSVFKQLADIFYNSEGNATLTSIVNGWKILQRSKNYIYLTDSSSETITLSQPAFNYYNGNESTRKRAFIERNGYFILDPFDEYSPTETYYAVHLDEPLQLTNSPLIIADKPEGEPKKIVTIKPRYNLNNLPANIEDNTLQNWYMNSLSILRVTLSNFGDYNLVALYPIPIKNNTVKTAEGQITYEARFIEGPTQVRYSTMGETEYDRNPYSIHINKYDNGEIINYDSDKNLPNTILPSVPYYWSICRRNKFSNFLPRLVEINPNLTNEDRQEMTGYGQSTLPILQPPVIYIPTEYAYGVTFYDNEIPVWTQPILVYEDRYPSTTLNQWNGSDISTDNETGTIVASAFAAGKKESDNTFTGVMLGDWSRTDTDKAITKQTGVFGFNHGAMSYALKDDGTAFFGKDGSGRIYFDGNSSTIYSSQWKGNNKLGMLLDVDDGYIELRGTSGTFETQQNIVIEDPNSVDDTYLVVPVQDASIYGAPFVKISSKETRYPIQVGLNNEAYFSVQWDGSISVTRGTISGACISSSLISGTNIFANYLQSSRGNIGGWQINHSSLSSPKTNQLGSDGYAAKTVLSPINGITTNRINITEEVVIPNSDDDNSEPTIGTIAGTLGLIYGYDGTAQTTAFGMKTSNKLIIEGGNDQVNRISGGEFIIGNTNVSRIVIGGSENDSVLGSKIFIGRAGRNSIIIDSDAYSTEIHGTSLTVNVPAANQTGIYARFA